MDIYTSSRSKQAEDIVSTAYPLGFLHLFATIPLYFVNFFRATFLVAVSIAVFVACTDQGVPERSRGELLIDQAKLLTDVKESVTNQLHLILDQYGVEVVVATLESTGPDETIRELTARLFTQWQIGRDYQGQGLLLLFAEREKEIRIEVGLTLEGVFTDIFTGYIENKQLKSYFLSNQLELGLIAVLEEIEARSALVAKGEADPSEIQALDMRFLSSGGGADVALNTYQREKTAATNTSYPAGSTPKEAWQTLIQSWRDKNRNPDIGVYTPVTRLIYRAFTSQPARRFEEDVRNWGSRPYEILENGNYAVIFFGNKKGWENAPFLLCKTEEGWQFDMVHQRKIVRMGRSPLWGIERGEHPYIELLSRCPYWMGQDIPRRGRDKYSVADDEITARAILNLEERLQADGDDFETLRELGRLYTLTSMGQQRFTMLNKALKLQPDNPEVLKNLAIVHVDAHYQYKSALQYLDRYITLKPNDPFGHFYKGYLHLMLDQPGKAIDALQRGLTLEPNNIYGLCKLARAHMKRNNKGDRQLAARILARLEVEAPGHIRTRWLKQALK